MVFEVEKKNDKSISLNVTPIFSVIKEVVFCLDENECWVKLTSLGKTNFESCEYDSALLTLLEISVVGLREQINSALVSHQFKKSLSENFPFDCVVYSGLKSASNYWVELTLNWLESDFSLIKIDVLNLLKILMLDKSYSQKVRQKMRKLVRNR